MENNRFAALKTNVFKNKPKHSEKTKRNEKKENVFKRQNNFKKIHNKKITEINL